MKFVPPEGGHVVVEVAAAAGMLRVSVSDNGPGIERSNQQVIFEKFRQAGDTMTAKPHGTGLGLPISRQIIEHFGGRLWVDSVPGAGATFTFELPVAAPAAMREPSSGPARGRDADVSVEQE